MRRRDFMVGAIAAGAMSRVAAQPAGNSRRLAIVSISEPSALMHERGENRYYRVLFAELRRLGYVYRDAVANVSRDGADAIMLGDGPDVMTNRSLIAKLIGEARIPAIYPLFELVEASGLMAYSFDLAELNRRVANNIDAILRGANPGDIPFYQSSKFELSINLKTAKVLGLTVPATLLASADNITE